MQILSFSYNILIVKFYSWKMKLMYPCMLRSVKNLHTNNNQKIKKDSYLNIQKIWNKNFQEIKNIFLSVANIVVQDRSVDWAVAALKVAKKENKKKTQLKEFQSLVSLAKSDHNETLNKLLELIKTKPNGGRKNKIRLLDAELKANGEALKHKHTLLEAIIERKEIRKLCQKEVSGCKSTIIKLWLIDLKALDLEFVEQFCKNSTLEWID